ncbi:golgi apparatus membrane protein tvp15 [Anaeramoeba flamelloides]|uniref:Golgi apparatus membrane protein tvp15 n=1 Tax=Anaeramoeba flamelloides TaxID=1746091 RepID=A0AAV7Z7F9_9EUKA|nr:golgi apparatus membrane protein tvp15 [Anaeramoeba flamelloides]KAJ6233458.1 golgi apparatus membrane protein tvp15 [Anaeramoeba flamelloides]
MDKGIKIYQAGSNFTKYVRFLALFTGLLACVLGIITLFYVVWVGIFGIIEGIIVLILEYPMAWVVTNFKVLYEKTIYRGIFYLCFSIIVFFSPITIVVGILLIIVGLLYLIWGCKGNIVKL